MDFTKTDTLVKKQKYNYKNYLNNPKKSLLFHFNTLLISQYSVLFIIDKYCSTCCNGKGTQNL